jgi:hypothetical protein
MSQGRGVVRVLAVGGLLLGVLTPAVGAPAQAGANPPRRKPAPTRVPAARPSPTPEPTPPPGWETARDAATGKVTLTRPSQEVETRPGIRWSAREGPARSFLAITCNGSKLDLALRAAADPPFLAADVKKEPVRLRLDQDKAFDEYTGFGDFIFTNGPALLRRLLGHDWLALRYVAYDGYREHTFDLTGLETALAPVESACGLAAGTVAAATAARPPGKRPAPPSAVHDETTVGPWKVMSRINRLDDTRTVVVTIDSVSPKVDSKGKGAAEEPARLVVRALGGALDVYVKFPTSVHTLGEVRFDEDPPSRYQHDSAAGGAGLFLSPTPRLLRDLARHRRMVVTAKATGADVVAEFDLSGFAAVAPRALEAAGLGPAVLVEAPRAGKWQLAAADFSKAVLRLPAEGAGDGGAALLIECKLKRMEVYLAAPGVKQKDVKGATVALGSEAPKTKALYLSYGNADLAPGATLLGWHQEPSRRADLWKQERLTVRFKKMPGDLVFDLSGLETWREPLEEAGCTTE